MPWSKKGFFFSAKLLWSLLVGLMPCCPTWPNKPETTPGPLIMVTQFVGFLGGWNHPGQLPPLLAATLGALVTTWTTFTPCFLWILLGGPYIEKLRGNEALTATLSAITAAVVGVVLNLAVWFGLQVFIPRAGSMDLFALLICAVAFIGMVRWKWDIVPVVFGAGLAGMIFRIFLLRTGS
jgi:chromate transporter